MIVTARCLIVALTGALCLSSALAQEPTLLLQPQQRLRFETSEVTWMALDVSPDGRMVLFDLLGDIYALDIAG